MRAGREAVAAALFAQLQNANGTGPNQFQFATFSRAPTNPGNLAGAQQPAAFLFKVREIPAQDQVYGLTKYVLEYVLLVYVRVDPTPGTIGETTVNAILDAFDAALKPGQGNGQTLGNLVTNAWIEGDAYIDTNVLNNQVAIEIPIKVITGD